MKTYAEIVPLNWSDLSVNELPTGTVTLLLADVEGSTRLWEHQPEQMAAALARLNAAVAELVVRHSGVRPLEQGEGDSFVVAFAKASDAVAFALALQRTALEPIKLRIGVHTGEIQLRDDHNYAGSTINRTARLRDLAHGGQTVLSGATEAMVRDRLPVDAWLADLGSHALRDLPRREQVLQLNHPDLRAEFPPLRVAAPVQRSRLPVQLTSFVGRSGQIDATAELLWSNRLVTLTGAGGAGKTRLALQVATEAEAEFDGEVFFVDLAPITEPAVVPVAVARALELTDHPNRTTTETLRRFVADRRLLVVLDNCEHLLDACSDLLADILSAGRQVSVLATSREPIGIPGEVTWRVPSLSINDDAVELFVDRARKTKPDFCPDLQQTAIIAEICQRLDGMPLAIELAAARTRTLSLTQILDSLRTSFRLLTGGARSAVRRQQTLSASIDWSHSLLTETERILLRRMAVFAGGFDLDASTAVGAETDSERAQLIDILGLLVDKSLIVADDSGDSMRYRMLETVRQYALEKLAASGEADLVRNRHRDCYADAASRWRAEIRGDGTPLIPWAETEMDNLRAAYAWSCENTDFETALALVSALQQFWLKRGRFREGSWGFEAVFADERFRADEVTPTVWAAAVADASQLAVWTAAPASLKRAQDAVAVAADTGDLALTARTTMALGMLCWDQPAASGAYLAESIELARQSGDQSILGEALGYVTFGSFAAGMLGLAEQCGREGWDVAESLGDGFMSRYCRVFLSNSLVTQGRLPEAAQLAESVVADARADGDRPMEAFGLMTLGQVFVFMGDAEAGESAETEALDIAADLGGFHEDSAYVVLAGAALVRSDSVAADRFCESALRSTYARKELFIRCILPRAETMLAGGDFAGARQWADDSVALFPEAFQVLALTTRARVALAQGEEHRAECDAYDALDVAERTGGYLRVPDAFECLAAIAAPGSPERAARLLGVAHGIRERQHEARFTVFDRDHATTMAAVAESLGAETFEAAMSDGAALSTAEAIAFARRGRGERKRPSTGWEALTPTELDVVRLLGEGLSNKEIAARLFISPRTAQTHLTHVYSKLDLSSRVQVVQEAARHSEAS